MTSPAHALARVRRVRVGTMNGPKIAATTSAIEAYAPQASIEGAAVASGVSEQPVGFEEIAKGARNRAARAFALGDCDLAVGYEDGLVELPALSSAESAVINYGRELFRTRRVSQATFDTTAVRAQQNQVSPLQRKLICVYLQISF